MPILLTTGVLIVVTIHSGKMNVNLYPMAGYKISPTNILTNAEIYERYLKF